MEKVYKTMKITGAANIALGITITVTGLVVGVLTIITGAVLLKRKSQILF